MATADTAAADRADEIIVGPTTTVLAIRTIVESARRAGGRLVIVDAIDDVARRFYLHHDFVMWPGDDRRLVFVSARCSAGR